MNKPSRPLVGAIRWDAWFGDRGTVGQVVQRTLGPEKYHHRLPFFAKVLSPDQVEIRGDSQEVMDREIAYAKAAGVDYWAFVTYESDTPLVLALEMCLASRHNQDVKFCLIIEHGRWGSRDDFQQRSARYVDLMARPSYQKVLGGRPLVHLGFIREEGVTKNWGSWDGFAASVRDFRAAAARAGLADPYIVIMDFSPQKAADYARRLGAQAISSYAWTGGTAEGPPYADLCDLARQRWDSSLQTGAKVVPLASFGWDPRPRIDHPTPWVKYANKFYQSPTAQQAAEHLRQAMDWTALHGEAAEAQATITYAWNEHDEGGWICPTRNADGTPNDERVRALGAVVHNWKPPR